MDIEMAADDMAASRTGRPLALASALAKVWAFGSRRPEGWQAVPALAAHPGQLQQRISRLMGKRPNSQRPTMSDRAFAGIGLSVVAFLVVTGLGLFPYQLMTHDHALLCALPGAPTAEHLHGEHY